MQLGIVVTMVEDESKQINRIVQVRDKGEITLPKNIREIIGVKPGKDHLLLSFNQHGDLCLHKVETENIINGNGGNTQSNPISKPKQNNGKEN